MHERLYAAAEADVGRVLIAEILGGDVWDELPDSMRRTFTDNGPAILAEERAGLLDVTVEELGTLACPILILAGPDSPAPFVDATERMAAAMPSARVEWVEGGRLIDPAHPAVLAFVDELQRTSR